MPGKTYLGDPTIMALANLAMIIFGALESSGATNVLFTSKWGAVAFLVLAGINGAAHAYSNPTPGPLNTK